MTSREEIEASIREIMVVIFESPMPELGEIRRSEQQAWDSLRHVELLFSIEDALEVRFSAEELGTMDSLAALVEATLCHKSGEAEDRASDET